MNEALLPGLPVDLIRAAYAAAPGNEIESGKFSSPESSAALVANTFGLFLDRAGDLPPLPGLERFGWPAQVVQLESVLRFPWRGGHHPCLDILVETPAALIGVESKRYEPFRPKSQSTFSEAYWRPVWGTAMAGYEHIRDGICGGSIAFERLDAAQLVKHALGLRSAVNRQTRFRGKKAILFYLYAEPRCWPDGKPIRVTETEAHRAEVKRFGEIVAGDEVYFHSSPYDEFLALLEQSPANGVAAHSAAIRTRFAV